MKLINNPSFRFLITASTAQTLHLWLNQSNKNDYRHIALDRGPIADCKIFQEALSSQSLQNNIEVELKLREAQSLYLLLLKAKQAGFRIRGVTEMDKNQLANLDGALYELSDILKNLNFLITIKSCELSLNPKINDQKQSKNKRGMNRNDRLLSENEQICLKPNASLILIKLRPNLYQPLFLVAFKDV